VTQDENVDVIRQLEEARRTAMLAGDAVALGDLLDEGLVYIHSTGARDNRDSYLDKFTSGAMHYEAVTLAVSEIQTRERLALVCGAIKASVHTANGTIEVASQYEALWMKMNGRWRLSVMQGFPSQAGADSHRDAFTSAKVFAQG